MAARDRRRIPFGRPALLRRMDDVLSLDGGDRQGLSLGETPRPQANAKPAALPVAIANGGPRSPRGTSLKAPHAHASSTGSNLFADRRIPSARTRSEAAAADGSPDDRTPNRHAGHSRRRKRAWGRRWGRSTIAIYSAVAVLVAAGVAAFVATRQPAGSSTSAAGSSAAAQRRHDRLDHPRVGSILPGGPPGPSASAVFSPPAAGGPSAAAGPAPTGPQPIGWWDLNAPSGMTAADSLDHQNGVAENITWVGGAAEFNGTNSLIEVPESIVDTGPGSSFTVAAWVDLASGAASATAVSQDSAVDSGFYLEYDQADNCWAFARHSSDTTASPVYRATSSGPPALNTWTALIGVFDGGADQLQIYVNGQLQGVASDPTPFASTGNLLFGRSVTDGVDSGYFPGLIGDVQVFNQALTQPEAESLSGY